jgi:hypothetical protein
MFRLTQLSDFGLDIVYVARQIGRDLLKRSSFLNCCAQFGHIKVGPKPFATEGCLHPMFSTYVHKYVIRLPASQMSII